MSASIIYKKLGLGLTTGFVAYHVCVLPHTTFLQHTKRLFCRYNIQGELPVPIRVQSELQEVMEDLKLPQDVRERIEPFSVLDFYVFHIGALAGKCKALIGIPVNFDYTRITDVDKDDILIEDQHIDWTHEDANTFIHSLVYSEKARKFELAREILRIQNNQLYYNAFSLASLITLLCTTYGVASYKLRLHVQPAFRRIVLFSLYLFGIASWTALKDHRSTKYEIENDKALSELGPQYIEGGQEYYDKMLKRNIAMRTLMGPRGVYMFTSNGNERFYIRSNSAPLTYKKSFFDSKLQNLPQLA